jgi:hypothetical protein
MFIAAFFAFWSLLGFLFHFTAGPSHGAGIEMGFLAGAIALVAGTVAVVLASRERD